MALLSLRKIWLDTGRVGQACSDEASRPSQHKSLNICNLSRPFLPRAVHNFNHLPPLRLTPYRNHSTIVINVATIKYQRAVITVFMLQCLEFGGLYFGRHGMSSIPNRCLVLTLHLTGDSLRLSPTIQKNKLPSFYGWPTLAAEIKKTRAWSDFSSKSEITRSDLSLRSEIGRPGVSASTSTPVAFARLISVSLFALLSLHGLTYVIQVCLVGQSFGIGKQPREGMVPKTQQQGLHGSTSAVLFSYLRRHGLPSSTSYSRQLSAHRWASHQGHCCRCKKSGYVVIAKSGLWC